MKKSILSILPTVLIKRSANIGFADDAINYGVKLFKPLKNEIKESAVDFSKMRNVTPKPKPITTPGIFDRMVNSPYRKPLLVGGMGLGMYGLGRTQGSAVGHQTGLNEGLLTAQQMAALQAMQMQQQARDTYANQGILDRVMGRNPF